MIPRRMRLSRAHFAPTSPETRVASEHFSVSVRKVTSGEGGVAAVIAKKSAKLSVSRHLLKRRMLAVLAPFYQENRAIIAYARPGAKELAYPALAAELEDLVARALAKVA